MKFSKNCARAVLLSAFLATVVCSANYVEVNPFVFTESKCTDCSLHNLRLICNYEGRCVCTEVLIADSRGSRWGIQSYDGNKNCSVGKFGPCGSNDGIRIDCHGDGITCVNGTCLDANHLLADVGEECASVKNCKEGLLCSFSFVCIEPYSLKDFELCYHTNECQKGLKCRFLSDLPYTGRCSMMTKENEPFFELD